MEEVVLLVVYASPPFNVSADTGKRESRLRKENKSPCLSGMVAEVRVNGRSQVRKLVGVTKPGSFGSRSLYAR
jgi:hypothetical protein